MAAKSKIVDRQEVLRWFAERRTYAWMVEQYRERGIETTPSMWSEFRHREGLDKRNVQDDELVPWSVEPHHRLQYPVVMLRLEGRRRQGEEIGREDLGRLKSYLAHLEADSVVVDYDPATERGFREVPREPSDVDIVRAPTAAIRRRKRAGRRKGDDA